MQLRLAFAVAAFLEPEILVIDEVLAVGDAEFQKKCMGKMEAVSKSGRTILFVSHNMAAVKDLCQNSLLLSNGKVVKRGKSIEVIDTYLKDSAFKNEIYKGNKKQFDPFVKECFITDINGEVSTSFKASEDIVINILTENPIIETNLSIGVAIRDKWGNKIFTTVKHFSNYPHENHHRMTIPKNLLLEGNFSFDVAIFVPNGNVYDYVRELITFYVNDYESEMASFNNSDIGFLNIKCTWA